MKLNGQNEAPVTYRGGRAYLNESFAGGAVKNAITPDELKLMHQRQMEAHVERQAASDLNLLRALKLGEALREMKE